MSHPPEEPKTTEKINPARTLIHPSMSKTEGPAAASEAPASPAMSEWDLLIGRPNRQEKIPQRMTASIAALKVPRLIASGLTIPVAIVEATAVPEKAPKIFKRVARAIATLGDRVLVEITVATALGASVQPLINSAMRTIKITLKRKRCSIPILRILHDKLFS